MKLRAALSYSAVGLISYRIARDSDANRVWSAAIGISWPVVWLLGISYAIHEALR